MTGFSERFVVVLARLWQASSAVRFAFTSSDDTSRLTLTGDGH